MRKTRFFLLAVLFWAACIFPASAADVQDWEKFSAILQQRVKSLEALKGKAPIGDKGTLSQYVKKDTYSETDCFKPCDSVHTGAFGRLDCQGMCVDVIYALKRQIDALEKADSQIQYALKHKKAELLQDDYFQIENTWNPAIGTRMLVILPGKDYRTTLDNGLELRISGGPYGACVGFDPKAVKLSEGKLWVKSLKEALGEKGFSVSTPFVVTGPRGTEFTLETGSPSGTILTVLEGQVHLYNRITKEELDVEAGQAVTVEFTGKSGGKKLVDTRTIVHWWDKRPAASSVSLMLLALIALGVVIIGIILFVLPRRKKGK